MATKVHMEALSPTMEEGQLVRWLKSEGDAVSNGDVLAEIETDKATMELVARGEGLLRKIFLGEGGTADVGAVIAVIAAEDEDISDIEGASGGGAEPAPAVEGEPEPEAPTSKKTEMAEGAPTAEQPVGQRGVAAAAGQPPAPPQPSAPARPSAPAPPSAPDRAAQQGVAAQAAPPAGNGGRVKASPLARRLAEEMGLDLARVQGSGPGGRVVKRDVEAAQAAGTAAAGAPAAPAGPAEPGVWAAAPVAWTPDEPEYEDVPTSQMRKAIAKRLVTSIGPVPTFYLTVDLDMTRVVAARERVNEVLEPEGLKVSLNDIVLKAVASALRRHPDCNAQWQEGFVRRFNAVHLGVAVAMEDGLITPVVRNAHLKGLVQISAEVRELAGRARQKRLQPDEYTGATFSVSNLGMFGIQEFTAIINPPEAGIVAVGGVEERAVVVDGAVVVQPRMRVTMSCDHRVIDGAQGSRFLQTLGTMLEEPAAILL